MTPQAKKAPAAPRLYLIDGHSYIYRAFFGIPKLTNSKGFPTNAIFGFATMLMKIIRERKPAYLAVAFDSKGPTKRHEEFEDYKAQRPEMPDTLQPQIPVIQKLVEALRIPALVLEGYEADDLIGTVVRQAEEKKIPVTVVSGDKDMLQLITPHTEIYDSMKDRVFREAEVLERFGVEPSQIIEIMGLMGDKIDNVPGVPGVGEKTAVALIKQFGTIENLIARADEISKPKLRENIKNHIEEARLSLSLVTIEKNCPVSLELEKYRMSEPDTKALTSLFREMEFNSLLRQMEPSPSPENAPKVKILESEEAVKEFIRLCSSKKKAALSFLYHQAEGASSTLLGLGLAAGKQAAFLPLNETERKKLTLKWIRPLLSDTKIYKICHDQKSILKLCASEKLEWVEPSADLMIASYLLAPNRRDHSLEAVTLESLGQRIPELPQVSEDPFPLQSVAGAVGARAGALLNMEEAIHKKLKAQDLWDLYLNTELPLTGVLARMELDGIKLDVEALGRLAGELDDLLSRMTEEIHSLAGTSFNLNSPKQLSDVLFNRLGLRPIKKTKTGFSTNEDVLQQLSLEHELPGKILSYRQLAKLKSTYVDALPRLVNPKTGRLHTSLNQTVTGTGRLSSSDPNLQNIPIKGDWGRRIRSTFIVDKGNLFISADYNQVELRILAHLSGDKALCSAFREGEDIHSKTAEQIFGLSRGQITSEMRRTAKSVNFGIVYGISPFGLSSTLGIPQAEAKQYIDRYLEFFSGVRKFMENTIQTAREKGYVTTLFSRRRPIPELSSPAPALRGLGERAALNTPIQGSAADVIKIAMIRIFNRLKKEGLTSRMLLQVHDELIFEVPKKEAEGLKNLVREEMEGAVKLDVPLTVDLGEGSNWAEAHG